MIIVIALDVCVQLVGEKWEEITAWLNVTLQLGSYWKDCIIIN